MVKSDVYREVKNWKRPIHITKAFAAKAYLKALKKAQIIAVTGSVGKTLTQNAISCVLSQKFNVSVGNENLDPTFRIPQTILKSFPWTHKLILEYGVEHPGDMDFYISIAKPNIAVVTHIAPTHLKYFTSINGVFDEKSKIVSALPKDGYAILNADDQLVAKMANLTIAKVFWFGQKATDGVKISHFKQNTSSSSFRLHYKGQKATVNWKIIGKQHLLSAYAAATVGIVNGLTIKQIAKGLSQTKQPDHRLQAITKNGWVVLDDTYNSSPMAVKESIQTLVDIGKGKYKVAVLGEMKDLGQASDHEHKLIGKKVAKTRINWLITVGPSAKLIGDAAKKAGFKGKISNITSTDLVTRTMKKALPKKAILLIKASRHAHLERVVYGLLDKPTKVYCYHCGDLA